MDPWLSNVVAMDEGNCHDPVFRFLRNARTEDPPGLARGSLRPRLKTIINELNPHTGLNVLLTDKAAHHHSSYYKLVPNKKMPTKRVTYHHHWREARQCRGRLHTICTRRISSRANLKIQRVYPSKFGHARQGTGVEITATLYRHPWLLIVVVGNSNQTNTDDDPTSWDFC